MTKYGKDQFARKYAELNDTSIKDAKKNIDAFIETAHELTKEVGDIVYLRDLFRLERVDVPERTYTVKDPKTKELKTFTKEATTKVKAKALFK